MADTKTEQQSAIESARDLYKHISQIDGSPFKIYTAQYKNQMENLLKRAGGAHVLDESGTKNDQQMQQELSNAFRLACLRSAKTRLDDAPWFPEAFNGRRTLLAGVAGEELKELNIDADRDHDGNYEFDEVADTVNEELKKFSKPTGRAL